MIDIKQEVLLAEKQIRPYIRQTPLDYSFYFSKLANCRVFLKLENLQHTGSFKARGAINKLLEDRRRRRFHRQSWSCRRACSQLIEHVRYDIPSGKRVSPKSANASQL
jgi:hypothetical protein